MCGKYEKVSFLILKTKIHLVSKKNFQVYLIILLKMFHQNNLKFFYQFFILFRPSLFALVSSIYVDMINYSQHNMSQAKENHYSVITNIKIYDIVTDFAYEIKSCKNQNLCLRSFDSYSYKGYRKDLQSILV